jgi:hemerythrin-like domain-containing protein
MKATELLQKQHRDVEALLERLRTAGPGDEQRLRKELAAALVAHTVVEQEYFYPAVRESLPDDVLEAIEEHGLIDVELARLLAEKPGDEAAEAKAAVLSELVVRHLRREESDIFKTAERELGEEEQSRLAEVMAHRFRQILDTGFERHLLKALSVEVPRTPARRRAAKKTARGRAAAAKHPKITRRPAARPKRTTARRASTERAAAPREEHAGTRKPAQKPARAKRAKRGQARAARARV